METKERDKDLPPGRPRTNLNDLPNGWRQAMRDIGQNGGSATEASVFLGISRKAWYTLLEDSQAFRDAEQEREMLSQVWWERVGKNQVTGSPGNSSTWIFNMKNRFGHSYKDKTDINLESEKGTMSPKVTIDVSKLSKETMEQLLNARVDKDSS